MKKIIVLGAGVYQVPLIRQARKMGLYTIVVSMPGNYPGFACADKVFYVDTTDKEAVLKVARDERIDAILTTGTDVAVISVGYVCDKMGLAGISYESAQLCTDKASMKSALLKGRARTSAFQKVFSLDEARAACRRLKFPLMFKCTDKSGSRGIAKAENAGEIKSAFDYAMDATEKDYIIIEEFIDGCEIGVDGYAGERGIEFIMPHSKLVRSNGFADIPAGHCLPFDGEKALCADISEQARRGIDALKLRNSFFNMDVMIRENKAYIIEIGGRVGATCIPEIISVYCGFDFYEKMIRCALGESVGFGCAGRGAAAARLLFSDKKGTLAELVIGDYDRESAAVSMDYAVGDSVPEFKNGTDRIGQIVASGKTVKQALENIEAAKQQIKLSLE